MARETGAGGAVKMVLLLAGGFAVYRWWSGRQVAAAPPEAETPSGITTEVQALLDSLARTVDGGPQPGDTTSVQPPADEPPAEEKPLLLRDKLLQESQHDEFFTPDHKANVYRWNWYLRIVTGLSEAETPDLAAAGDPADVLSVDQYLARRVKAGLSGLGLGQFRTLRRARYPVWRQRPGGRSACGCESTGCNCYRM